MDAICLIVFEIAARKLIFVTPCEFGDMRPICARAMPCTPPLGCDGWIQEGFSASHAFCNLIDGIDRHFLGISNAKIDEPRSRNWHRREM
jgi:hypothetical protein